MIDGLRPGFLKDPTFAAIMTEDLNSGQHRNPTHHPQYFMDTFLHHPDELRQEVAQAGFMVRGIFGVEGPGWLLRSRELEEWWDNPELRGHLLQIGRAVETGPSPFGVSAHLIAVAKKRLYESNSIDGPRLLKPDILYS